MRQMAEERERKLHYLHPEVGEGLPDAIGPSATAVGTLPSGVAELPVRVSGRYAHPSNQALAAR